MGFRVTVGAGSSAEIKAVAAHEFSEPLAKQICQAETPKLDGQ